MGGTPRYRLEVIETIHPPGSCIHHERRDAARPAIQELALREMKSLRANVRFQEQAHTADEFLASVCVVNKCSGLHSEPCGCSESGLVRPELAFGLQPILQFRARLFSALQINLVRTLSYFLLTR